MISTEDAIALWSKMTLSPGGNVTPFGEWAFKKGAPCYLRHYPDKGVFTRADNYVAAITVLRELADAIESGGLS